MFFVDILNTFIDNHNKHGVAIRKTVVMINLLLVKRKCFKICVNIRDFIKLCYKYSFLTCNRMGVVIRAVITTFCKTIRLVETCYFLHNHYHIDIPLYHIIYYNIDQVI